LVITKPRDESPNVTNTQRCYTVRSRCKMGIRRNFTHDCFVHPFCGVVWLIADVAGLLKMQSLKSGLVSYGERIHREK
jgi:hypothetical protein